VVIAFGKSSEHRAEDSVGECRFEMTPVYKVIYELMLMYFEVLKYLPVFVTDDKSLFCIATNS
jgi:hypothetical protein